MTRSLMPVAIVTGYSSGLGYALATALLDRNWCVVGVAAGHALRVSLKNILKRFCR